MELHTQSPAHDVDHVYFKLIQIMSTPHCKLQSKSPAITVSRSGSVKQTRGVQWYSIFFSKHPVRYMYETCLLTLTLYSIWSIIDHHI